MLMLLERHEPSPPNRSDQALLPDAFTMSLSITDMLLLEKKYWEVKLIAIRKPMMSLAWVTGIQSSRHLCKT